MSASADSQPVNASTSPGSAAAASAQAAGPHTTAQPGRVPLLGLKQTLLKIIDISALGFLEPVVRLCWAEEPRVQLRKLVRFMLIPIVAFVVFLMLWAWLAPKHVTRSGSVPTPGVVATAAGDIMAMHRWEREKERAFVLSGSAREREQQRVSERLALLAPERTRLEAEVAAIEQAHKAELEAAAAPLQEQLRARRIADRDAQRQRETELQAAAETMERGALLAAIADHRQQIEADRQAHRAIRDDIESVLSRASTEVVLARLGLARVVNEMQHLNAMQGILDNGNREARVAEASAGLEELEAQFASAEGAARFQAAGALIASSGRVESLAAQEPTMAYTLPRQILRSIFCVFVGFLVGVAIAVPIGVCCGLSPTFMAAVTPFIALFKPVSPIVWLLIVWIIVVGFIPDPDNHWLTSFADSLPLVGWMGINPAFIASAVTVALCSLWATMVNTALGVASVDKDHINVARVLRLGFWKRLRTIVMPSALPLMFAGMRISLGVGWMVLIAAELLSNSEGIGKFVWDQFNNGAADSFAKIMVCVFVVGFIGLILDRIMVVFQRLVSFEGSVASV